MCETSPSTKSNTGGFAVFKMDTARLREPASWAMVAVAATGVLIAIARLLISGSALTGGPFSARASVEFSSFVSPVFAALSVGAIVLATRFGPALSRAPLITLVAAGALAVGTFFGAITLLVAMAGDALTFRDKFEFLVTGAPLLALTGLALLFAGASITPVQLRPAVAPPQVGVPPHRVPFQQPEPPQ